MMHDPLNVKIGQGLQRIKLPIICLLLFIPYSMNMFCVPPSSMQAIPNTHTLVQTHKWGRPVLQHVT